MGLLGNILEPNPQGGLLSLAAGLLEAGGRGQATGSGLASAYRGAQSDMLAAREYQQQQQEYMRKQALEAAKRDAIAGITDEKMKLLATLDPSGGALSEVMAAQLKSQYGADPSAVKEYQYYNTLSPEEQQRYLTVKRAQQVIDYGGGFARVDPTGMAGPTPIASKTLAPGELPSTRQAQAEATAVGSGSGARQVALDQKGIDANDALSTLDRVDQILATGQATAGSLEQGRDAAAGVFGRSTKGAEDAASLDVLAGSLIGKVPRFEGPQSDSDRLLYQKMAGDLANSSKPIGVRKAAAAEVRRLHQKAASGAVAGKPARTIVRTGKTPDGRKVVQYSDGSIEAQ